MIVRAPAKLNLCLYVGPVREDGLHELRSLFCPLLLADRIVVEPAAADEVRCPGVEGPNLAAAALAGLRELGWDSGPVRVAIEKRIPVAAGLGGGSADAAAVLRLGAGLPGVAELAFELGADVPSQLEPAFSLVSGAGENVERLQPPAEFGVVAIPGERGLSAGEVYAELERNGLARGADELAELERRVREAAGAGASPLDYGELLRNDLEAPAVSLAPEVADALDALRDAGARACPRRRLRPDRGRPVRGPRRGRSHRRRAAAALLAGDRLVGRGRRMSVSRERRRQIILGVLIIAGFALVDHLLNTIDIGKLLNDVSEELGAWTYAIVGLAAFLETGAFVGLILPGESAVILGGAVAGQGATSIVVTIAVVWICAWAGDTVSFLLGRRLGRGFILEHGPKLQITHERFERVEAYFKRYGGRTILVGRFIGFVRAVAPFTAGSSGLRYRSFVPYSVLGTGLWSATFCLVGYYASQNIDRAAEIAGKSTFYFGLAVGVIVAVVVAFRYLREAENRRHAVEAMEANRLLRPLVAVARRVEPQARFLGRRLTTGELGLELTTLLATVAVGTFIVVGYAVSFGPDSGSTPGDRAAFDVAADLRADWLVHVAKALTVFGSAVLVVPVALVAAVVLGRQARWPELAVLVAGLAVVFFASDAGKAAVDRPRPPGSLVATSGASFPSGHAAHAMIYPFLAVLAAKLATGLGARWRSAILATGFLIALVVGLTRVYLRAHYMSDVDGGWALGAAGFAGAGALAMIVVHLRDTSGTGDRAGDDPH